MNYDGRYKFAFSKVPGKVMENEFTLAADGKGGFTGFMHNASGDHPITGTITENGEFAFDFKGGHRHAEQEGRPAGGPPQGGPGGAPGAGGPPQGGPGGAPGAGGPPHGGPGGAPGAGGPPHGGPGGGEPLVMSFSGKISDDGSLEGTLKVMEDVTTIKGGKI